MLARSQWATALGRTGAGGGKLCDLLQLKRPEAASPCPVAGEQPLLMPQQRHPPLPRRGGVVAEALVTAHMSELTQEGSGAARSKEVDRVIRRWARCCLRLGCRACWAAACDWDAGHAGLLPATGMPGMPGRCLRLGCLGEGREKSRAALAVTVSVPGSTAGMSLGEACKHRARRWPDGRAGRATDPGRAVSPTKPTCGAALVRAGQRACSRSTWRRTTCRWAGGKEYGDGAGIRNESVCEPGLHLPPLHPSSLAPQRTLCAALNTPLPLLAQMNHNH